jgi:hypothetical protein
MRLLLWLGVVVLFNLLNVMLLSHGDLCQKLAILYVAPAVFGAAAALACRYVVAKAGLRDRGWLVVLVGGLAGAVGFLRATLRRSRNRRHIFNYGMTAFLAGAVLTVSGCRTGDVEPPAEETAAVPAEVEDEGLEIPTRSDEQIDGLIRELAGELGSQDESPRQPAAEALTEAGDERGIEQRLQAQDVDREGEVEASRAPEARFAR